MAKIVEIPGRDKIKELIKEQNGYCPCSPIRTEDTKCPCKEFRDSTELDKPCHCGLYMKTEDASQD